MFHLAKDHTGQRFSRLVVLGREGTDRQGHALWRYRCDCGQEGVARGSRFRNGENVSCGCGIQRVTHGYARRAGRGNRTPTYNSWASMLQRCRNRNHPQYDYYGGRGIRVCERWERFENFLEDMGPCPVGLTLERIDNHAGYGPDNCKWATWKAQANNRRARGTAWITNGPVAV
jgi:hypothetical protein